MPFFYRTQPCWSELVTAECWSLFVRWPDVRRSQLSVGHYLSDDQMSEGHSWVLVTICQMTRCQMVTAECWSLFVRWPDVRWSQLSVGHYLSDDQCCHSEKMKNPRWANTKTQENTRSNFSKIVGNFRLFPGKIWLFPEKSQLSPKSYLLSANISDNLFFSHRLKISNFRQRHNTFPLNQWIIPCFSGKNTRKTFFSQKLWKTPEKPKHF